MSRFLFNEDVKQAWTQYLPLGYSAHCWPPAGFCFCTTDHHLLGLAIQPVFDLPLCPFGHCKGRGSRFCWFPEKGVHVWIRKRDIYCGLYPSLKPKSRLAHTPVLTASHRPAPWKVSRGALNFYLQDIFFSWVSGRLLCVLMCLYFSLVKWISSSLCNS